MFWQQKSQSKQELKVNSRRERPSNKNVTASNSKKSTQVWIWTKSA